ncbi:hypothetical protein HMPREF1090_00807 [[Clostridium] clostridioforme 90A8]|uniref:DUF927 domain-containing protein n=2 Tax=Enterocloster clostridioformis TaxID=1531 RepID=A0A0E2HGE9_9FIRM|nr:hypothetical protein HMPREF1090_02712 [[Clostridium] clostridioforme 90A8]ENZ19420.1 hypothetical protein HMPREF1090_00807 [[Clostridium] clostridioforme 90A8]
MSELSPTEPFPDEVFYRIFEIDDNVERTQYIEALRNTARRLKRATEFNNVYKSFVLDYAQRQKQTGQKTKFTDQPLELVCGEWTANDLGVRAVHYDKNAMPMPVVACSHPILPVEILKNVDTAQERITLAYFKSATWQTITVDRSVCANANKIVDTLSQFGIEVTSDNAKNMVRYISECVGLNPLTLNPKKSINRLGWVGNSFTPYAEDIRYEGDMDYEVIFRNVKEAGSFEAWKDLCAGLRQNIPLRMMMAASFASVLLEPLKILPFVLHVWGTTGTCKTVALMVAMSIWGNPKMGGLVKTMNMTKNAIMRNASFLCSIPFAGDELQTIKDKWQGNFDQLIYQITEGVDRGRARAYGGVEETRTWKNSFLFTGEEPITKANSGGGSKNRVVEIAIDGPLVDDGHYVSSVVQENYGFAGRRLVEYIQEIESAKLTERYRELFEELCRLDTTDKQAMAMACILLADELAVELFFSDEEALRIPQVKQYLQSSLEVDVAERAYQSVLNWAAKNPVRFEDPKADNSPNKGEVWGRIDGEVLIINRDVLLGYLDQNGFDYTAVSKKWAEKGYLLRNTQGKMVHQTKVYGIKSSYVKLSLPQDDDSTDKDGFVRIDYEQESLPFE